MISTSPNGKVEVNLVLAKARVVPLGGTMTPMMGISSAALLSRLMPLVLENCGLRPRAVFTALDSKCVVAALQRRSGLLDRQQHQGIEEAVFISRSHVRYPRGTADVVVISFRHGGLGAGY